MRNVKPPIGRIAAKNDFCAEISSKVAYIMS